MAFAKHGTKAPLADLTGREFRALCRAGNFSAPTAGVARGFTQANLVVVPAPFAESFRRFCDLNPAPCPLLEIVEAGCFEASRLAPASDLRTDLPRYRVMRHGNAVARPTSIESYWESDFVSFLIGCSFTFEAALTDAGVPIRHVELSLNVPMYRTNIPCTTAGPFAGPLVVSMRPMTRRQADESTRITAALPHVHGAPVHVGDPSAIGVADLNRPDYGDAVPIRADEIPVFWACGVTPLEAIMSAKPPIAITHEPGHMFVTDRLDASWIGRDQRGSAPGDATS